jgi:hypothetical protein
MYRFEVSEFIVISVDTDAEEEPSVATVDDFVVPELAGYRQPLFEADYV